MLNDSRGQEQAEAIMSLASAVATDEALEGTDYDGVSLVTHYGREKVVQYGFIYLSNGSILEWVPSKDDSLEQSNLLRDLMSEPEDILQWDACVIKISVIKNSVDCDFYYGSDASLWSANPDRKEYLKSAARP